MLTIRICDSFAKTGVKIRLVHKCYKTNEKKSLNFEPNIVNPTDCRTSIGLFTAP